ncbi:glycerophosphoryl diester phosphodiesterase membrane domain-containing protein [Kitasatospora phosalacinea]|uniref:glycerophosphoryl diester phosphodiesterase membrane domain-containing protein n=1 Tax=Kitasatospora phosalacinea TaxID=2065 RepID=UPI000A44933C|nr:glycerophosphoryl diester phosphodiesterase membrane domain-containing protein [Kitasatospora phosalacinea]
MSGDGGSPGQQQHGGQPQGPGAPGPGVPGPGGAPGHWPGYGQPGWGTGGWGQGPWGAVPVAPKPGVLPLRPLGFGEMFSAVFDTVRRYARPLYLPIALVAGIGAVPLLLASFLASGSLADALADFPSSSDADPTDEQVWAVVRPLLPFLGLFLLVALAQYVVAGPLAAVVLRAAVLGRKLTTGQAWKEVRPRLGASTAVLALLYGSLLLVYLLLVVVGLVGGGGVTVLLFLAFAFGSGYVVIRLAPQVPAVVLEEGGAKAAIRRAWQLNRNNWWRSFGLTTLVALVGGVGTSVLTFPIRLVLTVALPVSTVSLEGATDEQFAQGMVTAGLVVFSLIALFGMLATGPLIPLANGVLYIDRRIRNERLDIALAEAAGIRFAESYGYPQAVPAQPVPAPAAPVRPAPVPTQSGPAESARPAEDARPAEPAGPAEPPAGEGPTGS